MKSLSFTWVLLVLIVTAAAVYYFYPMIGGGDLRWRGGETRTFEWRFTEVLDGSGTAGAVQTTVTLVAGGAEHEIGTFDGSCFDIKESSWTLQEGELAGAICWWAGGGNEVGVFRDRGETVVKVGQLDEGTAETPGFRGNFETVLTI